MDPAAEGVVSKRTGPTSLGEGLSSKDKPVGTSQKAATPTVDPSLTGAAVVQAAVGIHPSHTVRGPAKQGGSTGAEGG